MGNILDLHIVNLIYSYQQFWSIRLYIWLCSVFMHSLGKESFETIIKSLLMGLAVELYRIRNIHMGTQKSIVLENIIGAIFHL